MNTLRITVLTICASMSSYAATAQEVPRCHVYVDRAGWVASDVSKVVKVRYDSARLCDTTLKHYVCYTYFESREGCNKNDASLVDLFLKDARAAGEVID